MVLNTCPTLRLVILLHLIHERYLEVAVPVSVADMLIDQAFNCIFIYSDKQEAVSDCHKHEAVW